MFTAEKSWVGVSATPWVINGTCEVLEIVIAKNGVPEIINSDQGLQYTSPSWTNYLEGKGIKISMEGKWGATDNIGIERFCKTTNYNHIYLNPCDTGFELLEGVQTYFEYYYLKKHQGIGRNLIKYTLFVQIKKLPNLNQNIKLLPLNFWINNWGVLNGEQHTMDIPIDWGKKTNRNIALKIITIF